MLEHKGNSEVALRCMLAGAEEGVGARDWQSNDADGPLAAEKRIYAFVKRAGDIFLSVFALIVLAPFLILLSLLIWLDDPHGSPIYISRRVGKDGKEFSFYKFRSMCVDADKMLDQLMDKNESDAPTFKIKNDPRTTRFGRVMRKYSIDELPQLLNIILGDMSIVGPRPPLPREVAQYTPFQRKRLSVKPGLTCYWQVRPKKNDMDFEKWVELDLRYIENRSVSVDLKLIVLTIRVCLKGLGK